MRKQPGRDGKPKRRGVVNSCMVWIAANVAGRLARSADYENYRAEMEDESKKTHYQNIAKAAQAARDAGLQTLRIRKHDPIEQDLRRTRLAAKRRLHNWQPAEARRRLHTASQRDLELRWAEAKARFRQRRKAEAQRQEEIIETLRRHAADFAACLPATPPRVSAALLPYPHGLRHLQTSFWWKPDVPGLTLAAAPEAMLASQAILLQWTREHATIV